MTIKDRVKNINKLVELIARDPQDRQLICSKCEIQLWSQTRPLNESVLCIRTVIKKTGLEWPITAKKTQTKNDKENEPKSSGQKIDLKNIKEVNALARTSIAKRTNSVFIEVGERRSYADVVTPIYTACKLTLFRTTLITMNTCSTLQIRPATLPPP